MPKTNKYQLTLDTQFLLAKLDLRTEQLLAECERLIMANANREAQEAALEEREALRYD